jgi:hypothetical protein
MEGYEGHFENLDGGYTVGFETYSADADLAPLYKGLPNDQCQCEHWGYVVKGKVSSHPPMFAKRPSRQVTPITSGRDTLPASTTGRRWSSSLRQRSSGRRWRSS